MWFLVGICLAPAIPQSPRRCASPGIAIATLHVLGLGVGSVANVQILDDVSLFS